MRPIFRVAGQIYRVGGEGGIGLIPPVPQFFAGDVSGSPLFSFNVVVDEARGFAYATQSAGSEAGPVARINLSSGRIDTLPLSAAYGLAYRHTDGSLFCYNHRGGPVPTPGSRLRRFQPHTWSPGDATVPALAAAGSDVSGSAEFGAYSPELDAVLIPRPFGIDAWDATALTASAYSAYPMSFGVHGMRWAGGQLWWVEGDQSAGGRWHVGGTQYSTLPVGSGSDLIPLPDLGRVAIVGYAYSSRGVWIFDASTGALLYTLAGFGDSSIGGSFADPSAPARIVCFDINEPSIRVVDLSDGSHTSEATDARRFSTGFGFRGRRFALPYSGADWSDTNCGILAF